MANLVLNGKSIDNIDDIAENFVDEDVLREFRSGSLASWLEEYGYEEELERVRSIKPTASSIMVLAGIIEALKLDDEVIARANAKRDEERCKEEAARKVCAKKQRKEEEQQNKEEGNRIHSKAQYDDISINEMKPSYVALVNEVFLAEDFQKAQSRLSTLSENNEYEERFLEYISRIVVTGHNQEANSNVSNVNSWLAIIGHESWRKYLCRLPLPSSSIMKYHYCAVDNEKDYISICNNKSTWLVDFNRRLFDVCQDPTITDLISARRYFPPYNARTDDGELAVYDMYGNPNGKLGDAINRYISW